MLAGVFVYFKYIAKMLWSFKMENGEGESVTLETVCHGGKRCDPRIELQRGHSCSTSLTT